MDHRVDGVHGREMSRKMLFYMKEGLNRERRRLSFLLAAVLLLTGLRFPVWGGSEYAAVLDGWKVDCAWSILSRDYAWSAEQDSMQQPKMVVTYRLENAERTYAPGTVSFDIPGIGNANRARIMKASDFAGDTEDSEWNCVWDQERDLYTFSNRFPVEKGVSLSGGFQLLWTMQSRETASGYHQERSPVFRIAGAGEITLEPLRFSFDSERDRYRIQMTKDKLAATDYETADHNYIWYEIETRFGKDWLARGLYRSSYYIEVEFPEGKDDSDVVIKSGGVTHSLEEITTESGETVRGFYPFENRTGNLGTRYSTYTDTFQIGFLKDHFSDEEAEAYRTVTVRGHLDRLYHDESEWCTEAGADEVVEDEVSFTIEDYGFVYDGYQYSHSKWNSRYEKYPSSHDAPGYSERLNAVHIYNGNVIPFLLRGASKRNYVSEKGKPGAKKVRLLLASDSNASDFGTLDPDILSEDSEEMLLKTDMSVATGSNAEPYSLVIGDDKLAVFLTDGSVRNLEDDEYDMVYVTIPSDGKGYEYVVYGAETQDTPFEEYVFCGSGTTDREMTIPFPEGIKAMYVRIDGITESYECGATVGVRLHLDWEAEQQKAVEGEPVPDHENHLINFSYLRGLYTDDAGNEYNDCAQEPDTYTGTYGKELAERDMETYGECMLRGYSNVWLRSPITELWSRTVLGEFEGSNKGGFLASVTAGGIIRADDSGPLEAFSLYTVIPDGLELDIDASDLELTGTGTYCSGDQAADLDFADHVSYSIDTYKGKTMLTADFDFSDVPLDISRETNLSITGTVSLKYSDYIAYGNYYTVNSYLMVHDDGLDKIAGTAIMTDEYDINKNGITSEKMAYSGDSEVVLDSAAEWREYVSKHIKSAYSKGYEAETVTRVYDNTDTASDQEKSGYSYRLDFGLGSDHAKNIDFFDRIEQGARIARNESDEGEYVEILSEWQGEFVSVDTTYAEKMKLIPTVYYSVNPDQELSVQAGGWSTKVPENPGDVKAIWVHLDTSAMEDGLMKNRQMTYVVVNMRAPSDRSLAEKTAVNQFYVQFDAYGIGASDDFIKRYELPSAETRIRLLDTVGGIILQKADGNHVIGKHDDGSEKYAALTGARFQIYDPSGNAMFGEAGKELNALGQIVLSNLPHGTYQWEEISAPPGYKKLEGRHPFQIDGVAEREYIRNDRIPGEVILTKYDQDDKEAASLPDAEFELFMDGVQIFFDHSGAYSDSGTRRTVSTGPDGTLKITNLPWGNYSFMETKAPYGYIQDEEPIRFTIGKQQYDPEQNRVTASVNAYNHEAPASILLYKRDSADGRGVKDAVFSLYRKAKNGETEDQLIRRGLKTNAAGELQADDLIYGEYYFVETRNPMGYEMPSGEAAITASVILDRSTTGQVLEITHTNDRMKGDVVLRKLDDAGQLVAGAEYTLMHQTEHSGDYVPVGIYTTDAAGEITVSDLIWGDYYFVETGAPKGYQLSEEQAAFTIDKDAVQSTVYLDTVDIRQKGSVKLTKVDAENKTKTLAGAVYDLFRTDGTLCLAGSDYTLPNGVDQIETDENGTVVLTGITQGGYYLQEKKAPESYSISDEKIRFSVTKENADILQELTAEDVRNRSILQINKVINEAYAPFGDPTFIFCIEKREPETGKVLKTSYKTITLSDGHLEGAVSFLAEQGYQYEIRELNAARYQLAEITSGFEHVKVEGDCAAVDLSTESFAEVTFQNELSQYEKLSHTANATNIIKTDTRLTGVRVEYHGPNPIDPNTEGYDPEERTYTIQESQLTVTALYDDGTSFEVPAGSYTLDQPVVDGSSNSYTGTVIYRESGVEKNGTFSIDVRLPEPWKRYQVIMELDGGTIVKDDDTTGTAVSIWERLAREGSTIAKPQNDPEKPGYWFVGWYADKECRIPYDFATVIEGTTHIYARWEVNYDVKYAVAIYAINDRDAENTLLPLTFGPASGADYRNAFVRHNPTDGEMCVHDMTWEEIIDQARKDPTVFQTCLENSCTHSVLINMTDAEGNAKAIRGTGMSGNNPVDGKMINGDGASSIYYWIKAVYRKWNHAGSSYYSQGSDRYRYGTNEGGWPDSAIRNTLNGVVTDNMLKITNKDNGFDKVKLDESTALISCFPEELQDAIYPRAIKSDTNIKSLILANVATTSDKLWLLSTNEFFADGLNPTYRQDHPLEGVPFERQTLETRKVTNGSKNGITYREDYEGSCWLRSSAYEVYYAASVNNGRCNSIVCVDSSGLAPAFSIGQEDYQEIR